MAYAAVTEGGIESDDIVDMVSTAFESCRDISRDLSQFQFERFWNDASATKRDLLEEFESVAEQRTGSDWSVAGQRDDSDWCSDSSSSESSDSSDDTSCYSGPQPVRDTNTVVLICDETPVPDNPQPVEAPVWTRPPPACDSTNVTVCYPNSEMKTRFKMAAFNLAVAAQLLQFDSAVVERPVNIMLEASKSGNTTKYADNITVTYRKMSVQLSKMMRDCDHLVQRAVNDGLLPMSPVPTCRCDECKAGGAQIRFST